MPPRIGVVATQRLMWREINIRRVAQSMSAACR
jgi:hypothetical protein